MTIEEAINLMKNKNEKGLVFLYDAYSEALMGIIISIVKSPKLAEEVLQQTFLKIWKGIDSYDPSKAKLFTWMARIARNTAIDQVRLKRSEYQSKTDVFQAKIHDQPISMNEAILDIEKLLSRLDEKYRVVLDLVYLKGYSHNEAAQLLNIPLGTVKTRLRAAISTLREIVQREKIILKSHNILIGIILLKI